MHDMQYIVTFNNKYLMEFIQLKPHKNKEAAKIVSYPVGLVSKKPTGPQMLFFL